MRTLSGALIAVFSVGILGDAAAEVRTWTSAADPTKTFEAELRSVEGDVVNLITPDGRLLPVKIEILSDADKEFIKAQAEAMPVPATPLTRDELAELKEAPLYEAIENKLVHFERNSARRVKVEPAKYYLVYHGASFSGPCFDAAPGIGTKYTEMVATNPKVEMIYVAHDKEEEGMEEMLAEFGVPIPTLKFGEWEEVELINKHLPEKRVTVPLYHLLDWKGELVESGEGIFEKLKDLE